MILIDENTALIFDTDDLKEAVSTDNGVDTVYFGADITLAYGVTIFPGKPSLTFDGTYLGTRHTFTDMNDSNTANTLGVRSISGIAITFQNIDLIGRNFYGIPYVPNGSVYNGVSTIYHNVTYTGTQICHNPYGFARFTDCNITITSHEVAEVNRVEIGGVTNMYKSNDDNAVFWFYGSSTRPSYLKILSGAEVTITTEHYFMYESYPPEYIIEPDAKFELNTKSGIAWNAAHTIASFSVGENGSFRFTQAVNTRNIASLYLDGALTVNNGAYFYMQADFENTNQLIRFTGSSGGLHVNNPKSFVLYNRGTSAPRAFYFAAAIPVTLSGGQVNYWEQAAQFPDAGTYEDAPLHKWNRPGYGTFRLQGTASNSVTNITFNDFTPEELLELPPLSDLQLREARVLSIGQIPLEIYSSVITRRVTGMTEPQANVKIVLRPSYYEDPHTAVADENGMFAITPTTPTPFSDYVEVFSNTPFLIVSSVAAVLEEDVLYIESAPLQINFPPKPMLRTPDIILPRDEENTDSAVVVVDTRAGDLEWQLWVNISGPLKTDENDVLTDAVVFGLENDYMETVQTEFKAIYTGQNSGLDKITVTWPQNRGVLARITVPIRSGKRYTTTLGWEVTPMGEVPEETDII